MPFCRSLATLLLLSAPLAAELPEPRVLARYKQMLAANPAEGTVLDRLWKLYSEQGQTAQLIAEYEAAATLPQALIAGHLWHRAGKLDKARAAFEQAAKLDPKSPLPLLALARLSAEAGQPRESAGWYEKAVARSAPGDPQPLDWRLALGEQWLAAGAPAKAGEAWEPLVRAHPEDLALRRRLAETYAQNHLPDQALQHLDYLAQHAPPAERALAWQQIARLHQTAGRQDPAIAALEKALALTAPGNWLRIELQSQLIRLHQRWHRTAELEARWKQYATDNPRDLGGCLQLIDFYERLGDLEHERLWLEKLTQAAPKNADYRLRLARVLVQLDQGDAAAPMYDALLAEQPANPDFVFERARLEVQRDAVLAARGRIARLLEAHPGDEPLRARALEFFEQNRLPEAVEQHLVADASAGTEESVLALAAFYFRSRRDTEGRQALERLLNTKAPPAQQGAAHLKIAQALKSSNRPGPAAAEAEKAAALLPAPREAWLLVGELQTAQGHLPAAQLALEKAVDCSRTPAEQAEADQKLFASFRAAQTDGMPEARPPGVFTLPAPSSEAARSASNPALAQFIAKLEQEATAHPSEEAWLRAARWRLWNRDVLSAHQAIGNALALRPDSVAAYELLVKVTSIDGPTPASVFHLMKLAEIDPANRMNYQRRAGQFELQEGRIPEALSLFSQLVQEAPGNLDALTDLALTQQRADRWKDALETWQQIYTLSPISRKKEALAPLLAAMEKLDQHAQAAELQWRTIEAEPDEHEQFRLFGELLNHSVQRKLLPWLRARCEQRRAARPDDYFSGMALGRTLKAMGDKAGALDALADASYAAPNQAEALPELIKEAEDLRKLDAAIKLQTQLLRITPQPQPQGFEELAVLQEKNFDLEGAARTWDRLASRFPRDSVVLSRAVEFQLRWGTPARAAELLRKVRVLDPANAKSLASLADLDLEAGALPEAEACLEQILENTPVEAPGEPIRYPALKAEDAGRLQTAYLTTVRQRKGRASSEALRALRSFWVEEAGEARTERDFRLQAIRQLGHLTRERNDPKALAAWVRRWRSSPAPSESLWALYSAGAGEALLDRMEELMKASPHDAKMPQAFIWLALQTGQFPRLNAWLSDPRRNASERDYLQIALGQYLNSSEGRIDPALLENLFPKGFELRLWQTAQAFAARNRFHEAAVLGRRIYDSAATQKAGIARELARWLLLEGDVAQAQTVLRGAIGTAAESFDADLYGALRDYDLLLPLAERAGFVERYLGAIDERHLPVHRAIAGALLRGLAGEDAAARAQLDALLALGPLAPQAADDAGTAGSRRWRLLLVAGAQLQAWRLDSLAGYLWEKALADDALIHLQGDLAQETARDVRQRLCALRVATAAPIDAQTWIDEYARISPRDGLAPLAEALESLGASARAIEVYRQLWERDPANPQAMRNLLNACRAANDSDTAEAALWAFASGHPMGANDPSFRDLMLQLVDLLEHRDALGEARKVLDSALERAPADARLLYRLSQLHEHTQRPDLAEAVLRRLLAAEPSHSTGRLALCTLLENQGRAAQALELLQQSSGPEVDARMAPLQLKAGRIDEALSSLERVPAPQHVTPSLAVASLLAERGERRLARTVIQKAAARTTDPGMSFPLLCKAVELLVPEDGPAAARLDLRRVRQVASEQPGLLGSYLDFAQAQSARLGLAREFATELDALWADGAGPIAAGAVLLANKVKEGAERAIEPVLERMLTREDAGEVWLYRLAAVFENAGQAERVARVRGRIARLTPANEQLTLDWVEALRKVHRDAEARAALTGLAVRPDLSEEVMGKTARLFAELGHRAQALELYRQALRRDPYARTWQTYLDYARWQLGEHDLSGAQRTLRTAYGNPANRDFQPFVEWIQAAGREAQFEAELTTLSLASGRQGEARRAWIAQALAQGRLPAALAAGQAHPEVLTPPLAAGMRALAQDGGTCEAVAALLEPLVRQQPGSDLRFELARLHAAWSAFEVGAAQTDSALAHLRRAHELAPGIFSIARDLAALQSQTGGEKAAEETLQTYLAAARDPAELEKARSLLARLRSGGHL